MFHKSFSVITAAGILIFAFLFGCKPQTLKSDWLNSSSMIENEPDWLNLPHYKLDDLKGTLTLDNDSSFMFVRFFSTDRRLAGRFKAQGLTIWLTNPKDKNQKLEIHYPMGTEVGEMNSQSQHFLPNEDLSSSEIHNMLDMRNEDIEILAQDSTLSGRKISSEAERLGLRAELSEQSGGVQYLLRIKYDQIAPWIKPGSNVLLEAKSAAMDFKKLREENHESGGRHHGGMGGGGMGRGGGFGHGGHGGGMRGGGSHEEEIPMNQVIHFLFTVQLTSEPATP